MRSIQNSNILVCRKQVRLAKASEWDRKRVGARRAGRGQGDVGVDFYSEFGSIPGGSPRLGLLCCCADGRLGAVVVVWTRADGISILTSINGDLRCAPVDGGSR